MNIVAYCRVSTNKDDQLNSLEMQKQFFEEYAQKNNSSLIRIYADEGITGTKLNKREEFKRLLRDSEKGLFDMVVTKDISRFSRNALDFLREIRNLKSRGIQTRFITANLTSEDSEMVLGTLALVAQEESANTSKRIKNSKKMNAEKGKVPNLVYGYDKTIGDYFNLTINKQEAEIVRKIYDYYINEGYGASKIAGLLNKENLKTKRDCAWSQNAVARILTNSIYTGKIYNGKEEIKDFLTGVRTKKDETEWILTQREDFRIIDDETFKKAQDILQKYKYKFKVTGKRNSDKHLFSTLIRCKECGYSFRQIRREYQNVYITWVCSGRNANGVKSCDNVSIIPEAQLKQELETYLRGLVKDKQEFIKRTVTNFNKIYKDKDENSKNAKDLKNKLKKLTNSRNKTMEMYQDDTISREEMRTKMGELNKDIERVQDDLKVVEYNITKGDMLGNVLENTFKDIETIISLDNMTNAQLKKFIEKIEVDKQGNIDIYLKMLTDIGLSRDVLVLSDTTYGNCKIERSWVIVQ